MMVQTLACVALLALARAAPVDQDIAPIPYRYEYSVDVPETGDRKAHSEERDTSAVVVGSFQVVDPTGNLRKLSYRVEGDSGFVITGMQLVVGFAPPPPPPSTYSSWRPGGVDAAQSGGVDATQTGGVDVAQSGGVDAARPGGVDGARPGGVDAAQSGGVDAAQAGGVEAARPGGVDAAQAGGVDAAQAGGVDVARPGGGASRTGGSSSSSGEGLSQAGGSSEQGSSGSPASGPAGRGSGASGAHSSSPQDTQSLGDVDGGDAPRLEGPAFTFSIVRTRTNRFTVRENVDGHQIEFQTHGGKPNARSSAAAD